MEPVTDEGAAVGAGDVLRGAQRAADYATEILNEPVTRDQIFYWAYARKVRARKFGKDLIFLKTELREDLRGKVVA